MVLATTAAVVGTGLIGGSFGLALKERGLAGRVLGVDRRPAARELARARGAADEIVEDPGHAVYQADLVVLATPVSEMPQRAPDRPAPAPHVRGHGRRQH
jgi:prephenate dehydrogenase